MTVFWCYFYFTFYELKEQLDKSKKEQEVQEKKLSIKLSLFVEARFCV